jgi:hypothetical protein
LHERFYFAWWRKLKIHSGNDHRHLSIDPGILFISPVIEKLVQLQYVLFSNNSVFGEFVQVVVSFTMPQSLKVVFQRFPPMVIPSSKTILVSVSVKELPSRALLE